MPKRIIIYCDESDRKGTYYSNFYGGVLIREEHIEEVVQTLDAKKGELGLHEIKWNNMCHQSLEKYKQLVDVFFDLVYIYR